MGKDLCPAAGHCGAGPCQSQQKQTDTAQHAPCAPETGQHLCHRAVTGISLPHGCAGGAGPGASSRVTGEYLSAGNRTGHQQLPRTNRRLTGSPFSPSLMENEFWFCLKCH